MTVESINLAELKSFLTEYDLPHSDLSEDKLDHFIVLKNEQEIIGTVGLELFPPFALLRSLAVAKNERSKKLGAALVTQLEAYAKTKEISEIYLLTTTAETFFHARNYETINRDTAPDAIKQTSEFSSICPASAAVMRKVL